MITQTILNFLADLIRNALALFPPMPPQWQQLFSMIQQGGTWLSERLSPLGVLIPWDTFTALLVIWVGLLTFWFTFGLVRVVLWAFGR